MRFSPVLLALAAGLLGASPALAERFDFRPHEENRVEFESRAPLETFTGSTRSISGYVDFDPMNLGTDSIEVEVRVDLKSLDTGIGLRNKHMRENHLETDKYPAAVFRGGAVSDVSAESLSPGKSATLKVSGSFEIHGVARDMVVPVTVERDQNGSIWVSTRFQVRLDDHEIERPSFLMLKLDQVQRVRFRARAVSVANEEN